MKRIIYLVLAYFFLGLALIGVALPGLPTVPFLLLTAWCASRGSESLHQWLYDHPKFGKLLIDWEREGAISRRTKIITVILLVGSWIIMYYRIPNFWVQLSTAIIFMMSGTFVVTRPEPAVDKEASDSKEEE